MIWAIQNLAGNSFAGYVAYFLEQAGLDPAYALDFTLGKDAINILGVFGSWFLMSLGFGRRSLYLYGLCGLFIMLMILGFLGLASDRNAASIATGAIMLVWATCYQLTVGTVCYSLVGEMSTRRLQIKTVALGRATYIIVAIICKWIIWSRRLQTNDSLRQRAHPVHAQSNGMELAELCGLLPIHHLHLLPYSGTCRQNVR